MIIDVVKHFLFHVIALLAQALFIMLLLGWLFVPVYLTAGVSWIINDKH